MKQVVGRDINLLKMGKGWGENGRARHSVRAVGGKQ
jgi:hypothetical protein